jgi:hypothetical protein
MSDTVAPDQNGTIVDGALIQHRRFASDPPGRSFDYRSEVSTTLAAGNWNPIPSSELVKRLKFMIQP